MFSWDKFIGFFEGDEEIAVELAEAYLDSYEELFSNISNAISGQSHGDLELHAHTLKGVISNFFEEEIKDAAFKIEELGKNQGSFDEAQQLYLKLVESNQGFCSILKTSMKS